MEFPSQKNQNKSINGPGNTEMYRSAQKQRVDLVQQHTTNSNGNNMIKSNNNNQT